MKTAVVILNWNGYGLLKDFLPSVVKYSDVEGTQVIVADNNSSDDSLSLLNDSFPEVEIVNLPENFGYAEGYNRALAQIDAEYMVLLNSDVEVTEGWLRPIVDFLDKNPDVAAVQPKLLDWKNKACFEYAGAAGGFIDKYGYPFCRGRVFDAVEKDIHQYDTVADIFWATGACLAIRKNDFFEAGGFDASFFAHMEEIDLCWRLNARGRRVVCVPQSVVYHLGGATLSETSPHKTYLNFRNNLLMLYKNVPDNKLNKILRIRLFFDTVAIVQMWLSGKPDNAKAVIKARKEFRRIRHNYRAKRKENIDKTINSIPKTIYNKSLLWAFHVRRLKKYNQIYH